jgi:hypothetical protein
VREFIEHHLCHTRRMFSSVQSVLLQLALVALAASFIASASACDNYSCKVCNDKWGAYELKIDGLRRLFDAGKILT